MLSSGLSEDLFLIHEYFKFNTRFSIVCFTISFKKKMFNPLSGRFPSLIHPSYFYPNPPLVCLMVFLKILVPSKSYWKWWKGLLAVKSLFKCHLFINAANKIVAGHSMRRGEVYLSRKLPPTIFASPYGPFSSSRAFMRHLLSYLHSHP